MKIKINFRTWFSDHLVAVSFIFALTYQLLDIVLNYFVSGELKQGISNFYHSPDGAEDLTRFLVILLLFIYFGAESRSIIRENIKAAEDQSRRLNEIKSFANTVVHDVKNPAIGIHTMAVLLKKKYGEMIDDQGKHYFEIMEQTSKDIVALMESVNVFIRAREYPLTFETVNLQHEIAIIKESVNTTLEVRRIEWSQRPETFPRIRGDRLSIPWALKKTDPFLLKRTAPRSAQYLSFFLSAIRL
jgi:signal transduction histidine kinase